jgi:hypothetical protein
MLNKHDSHAQGFRLLDQTTVENGGDAVRLAPDSDEVADILTSPSWAMGLAISHSIIQSHGGQLSARSNALRGAIFEFELPVRQPPAHEA